MKTAILILAAGLSNRFSRAGQGNKLTALLHGKPVLQHTLENARATGFDVCVVTRSDETLVQAMVRPDYVLKYRSDGMGDSIAAGIAAVPDYDGWLIVPGDMPFLTTSSYLAVGEALKTSPVARAEVNGIAGHPVGFQRRFYSALTGLTGDSGARSLLTTASLTLVRLADRGCLQDIDTREELRLYNRSGSV